MADGQCIDFLPLVGLLNGEKCISLWPALVTFLLCEIFTLSEGGLRLFNVYVEGVFRSVRLLMKP